MQAIVWEGFTGGCRPRRGGWGSDDNNYDSRGDDDVNNVRPCPPHATINLSDKEKRGTFRRGERGGAATVGTILQGRVGDASDEEKICTGAMMTTMTATTVMAAMMT